MELAGFDLLLGHLDLDGRIWRHFARDRSGQDLHDGVHPYRAWSFRDCGDHDGGSSAYS